MLSTLTQEYSAVVCCCGQIRKLLQDVDKRDVQIDKLKGEQNESVKREDRLQRELDRLTFDNGSLQSDLSASRDELNDARHNIHVCLTVSHGVVIVVMCPLHAGVVLGRPERYLITFLSPAILIFVSSTASVTLILSSYLSIDS